MWDCVQIQTFGNLIVIISIGERGLKQKWKLRPKLIRPKEEKSLFSWEVENQDTFLLVLIYGTETKDCVFLPDYPLLLDLIIEESEDLDKIKN